MPPEYYYIAGSYVKWLELAGVRSIPIPWDADEDLVDELFYQVDGVLLPGGASKLPIAAQRIWNLTLAAHHHADAGDYYPFPLWGTCQGYEYIIQLAATDPTVMRKGFDAENLSLALELQNGADESFLYGDPFIRTIVTTENVTFNAHAQGVSPIDFLDDLGLTEMFVISSINHDRRQQQFVSTIEPRDPRRHPIYGVQYHPEKNAFEYGTVNGTNKPYQDINHSNNGVYFSVSVAQFFGRLVQQFASSPNSYRHNYADHDRHPLIYSYPVILSDSFEQKYVIPSASHWKKDDVVVAFSTVV
jgi:gamma-glutamyl hydrolase